MLIICAPMRAATLSGNSRSMIGRVLIGFGRAARHGLAGPRFERLPRHRDAAIAARAAQLLTRSRPCARRAARPSSRASATWRISNPAISSAHSCAGAGFELAPRVPALGILGDQRRAIPGFVGPIFRGRDRPSCGFRPRSGFPCPTSSARVWRISDFAAGRSSHCQASFDSFCSMPLWPRRSSDSTMLPPVLAVLSGRGMPALDSGLARVAAAGRAPAGCQGHRTSSGCVRTGLT